MRLTVDAQQSLVAAFLWLTQGYCMHRLHTLHPIAALFQHIQTSHEMFNCAPGLELNASSVGVSYVTELQARLL